MPVEENGNFKLHPNAPKLRPQLTGLLHPNKKKIPRVPANTDALGICLIEFEPKLVGLLNRLQPF